VRAYYNIRGVVAISRSENLIRVSNAALLVIAASWYVVANCTADSKIMAERNLPWIPSPRSPRTERTTSHHDIDDRREFPLYSQVLTSRMTPTSSPKADIKVLPPPTINDSPESSPDSTKPSLTAVRLTASPRREQRALSDVDRTPKRSGAQITTPSDHDIHNHKVQ
jgi:hypothetical protein